MIPMDFGVFDLSVYSFITGVRKREEKSGYDKKNFYARSFPLPLCAASLSSVVILRLVLGSSVALRKNQKKMLMT